MTRGPHNAARSSFAQVKARGVLVAFGLGYPGVHRRSVPWHYVCMDDSKGNANSVGSWLSTASLIAFFVIILIAVVFSLVQCVTPRAEQAAAPEPARSSSELFLTAARSTAPDLESVSDRTLLDAGNTVCSELDAGTSMSDIQTVALIGMGGSGTAEQWMAGAVIGAATGYLCPEHRQPA